MARAEKLGIIHKMIEDYTLPDFQVIVGTTKLQAFTCASLFGDAGELKTMCSKIIAKY